MKEFFKNKGVSFWISLIAALVGLVGVFSYIGANVIETSLVQMCYILAILGVISLAVSTVWDCKGFLSILAPALFIAVIVTIFYDNATTYMLAFWGVAQGTGEMGGPNAALYLTSISYVLSALAGIVACFFEKKRAAK